MFFTHLLKKPLPIFFVNSVKKKSKPSFSDLKEILLPSTDFKEARCLFRSFTHFLVGLSFWC